MLFVEMANCFFDKMAIVIKKLCHLIVIYV